MPELASNPPDLLQPKRSLFQKLAIFVAVLNLLEVVYWILNHQLRTVNLEFARHLTSLLFFSLFGWKRPEALPRWAKALACVLIGALAVLIALQVYYGRWAFFNHAMT